MEINTFKEFVEYMESAGSGTIIMGQHQVMSRLPAGINFDTNSGSFTKKKSHPELDDVTVSFGLNPEVLVVRHQDSGLQGLGQVNCINCQHFQPNQICPKTEEQLNQATVDKYGNGGCVFQELLPSLGEQQGDMNYPNVFFEQIIDKIFEGNVAVLTNGQVKYLSLEDLGITLPEDDFWHKPEQHPQMQQPTQQPDPPEDWRGDVHNQKGDWWKQ